MFIVSTTDFFFPNVEDPYLQGRIALANVLSDLYAMGVAEVDSVLMILAASLDMDESSRDIVARQFIKGFDDAANDAGTAVTGGQTVKNPWPIIGGVAKSVCREEDFIRPINAQVGDVIILTKPLGTQVAVNVRQYLIQGASGRWAAVKSIMSEQDVLRALQTAICSMMRLNKTAASLMHKHKAHAATDVTGFGIMGHANNLASNQLAKVSFRIHTLPIIKHMKAVAELFPGFKLLQGYSAETSGGLLVCLPRERAEAFITDIQTMDGHTAWIVGEVIEGDNNAILMENPEIIDV